MVTYLINDYGAVISAANAYSGKIKDLSGMFISAMSTAAASMVARNLGAGLYDRGKQVMYTAMRMALAMAAVIIVVVELAAPVLVGAAFTDDPQAISLCGAQPADRDFGTSVLCHFSGLPCP